MLISEDPEVRKYIADYLDVCGNLSDEKKYFGCGREILCHDGTTVTSYSHYKEL